jgi:hypothetical protein
MKRLRVLPGGMDDPLLGVLGVETDAHVDEIPVGVRPVTLLGVGGLVRHLLGRQLSDDRESRGVNGHSYSSCLGFLTTLGPTAMLVKPFPLE